MGASHVVALPFAEAPNLEMNSSAYSEVAPIVEFEDPFASRSSKSMAGPATPKISGGAGPEGAEGDEGVRGWDGFEVAGGFQGREEPSPYRKRTALLVSFQKLRHDGTKTPQF